MPWRIQECPAFFFPDVEIGPQERSESRKMVAMLAVRSLFDKRCAFMVESNQQQEGDFVGVCPPKNFFRSFPLWGHSGIILLEGSLHIAHLYIYALELSIMFHRRQAILAADAGLFVAAEGHFDRR